MIKLEEKEKKRRERLGQARREGEVRAKEVIKGLLGGFLLLR